MLWLRDEDWTYELFSLDENPVELSKFFSLISLWRSKCVDGRLPKWADFELNELKDWWGWLAVYDFEGQDRERIKVRLWGTKVAEYSGFDLTGKMMEPTGDGAIIDARHFTEADIRFHRTTAETRQISYMHGPVRIDMKGWQYLYDIGLPLATDGENVDKLIYASVLEQSN